MKDISFERAMNQIANEAEQEQLLELKVQRRRQIIAKIRQACIFLFGVGAICFAFYHQGDIQQFASKLCTDSKPKTDPKGSVAGIQAAAAARDKAFNEITK